MSGGSGIFGDIINGLQTAGGAVLTAMGNPAGIGLMTSGASGLAGGNTWQSDDSRGRRVSLESPESEHFAASFIWRQPVSTGRN